MSGNDKKKGHEVTCPAEEGCGLTKTEIRRSHAIGLLYPALYPRPILLVLVLLAKLLLCESLSHMTQLPLTELVTLGELIIVFYLTEYTITYKKVAIQFLAKLRLDEYSLKYVAIRSLI